MKKEIACFNESFLYCLDTKIVKKFHLQFKIAIHALRVTGELTML